MTIDDRIAEKLRIHPEQVRHARDEWNASPNATIMRAIIEEHLTNQLLPRMNKLKKIKAEELPVTQGEIAGIELSLSLATKHPMTNEQV